VPGWVGNYSLPLQRLSCHESGYYLHLAYVVYHFHEVVTSLKTNEVVSDGLTSAIVTLKKDETGKWRIAFIAYT
jgi:hypothetical protein